MTDVKKDRLLIVASEAAAGKLTGILSGAGIEPAAVMTNGEEAIASCREECALVLSTYVLPDMAGEQMACQLGENTDVLMIVPQGYSEPVPENVMLLHNPLTPDALVLAVRTMLHCRGRVSAALKKASKLERMLEERKLIDRAKGRLMDELHLTEAQAHHHIQRKSMDSGRRIVDVAREILEAQQLNA